MKRKAICKAIIAIAVAMAFVMPVAAFANVGTIGVISNSENTGDIENMVESTTISDNTETNSDNSDIEEDNIDVSEEDVEDESAADEYMVEEETNTDTERRVDKVFIEVTEDVSPELEVPQEVCTMYMEGNNGEAEPYVPPTDMFGDVDLVGERTQVILTGITIYVDDDNTEGPWVGTEQYPYQYIWQGIENATEGDIVYVFNGIYYENVVVDKPIQFIGESKENTIIDAQNYGTVVVIGADNVVMKNFQLKDGGEEFSPNRDSGVKILGDYVTFENCELYENFYCIYVISWYSTIINCTSHDNEYGLFLWYTGSKNCRHNEIINFLSYDDGTGIYSSNSHNNTHINCTAIDSVIYAFSGTSCTYINCKSIAGAIKVGGSYFTFINCSAYGSSSNGISVSGIYNTFINCTTYDIIGTDAYSGCGIQMWGTSDNTFIDCRSYNNSNDGLGFIYAGSSRNVFTNCEFYDNGRNGISCSDTGYEPSDENIFTDCISHNNSDYAVFVNNGQSNEFTGCTFADSHWGVVLRESPNCVLSSNSINNNDINFDVQGAISDYDQNIDPTNTINGKYIYYLVSQVDKTLSNVGFLALIDCTNISINSSDMYGGIIIDSQQVKFTNVDSHAGGNAFFCSNSDDITLINCKFYDCDFGVQFLFSSEVIMRDTHIYDNTFNFKIDNDDVNDFRTYDMDKSNTIQGKTIFYVFDISDMVVEEDIGLLGLISCHNVTVKEQSIPGAIIIDSTEITLADTLIHDAAVGVYLYASSDTTITNCTIHNAAYGILLIDSDHNTITECTVYNDEYVANTFGIRGNGASHNNSISNCEIANYYITQRWCEQSADNTVTDTVIHDGYIGFYVRDPESINNYWYNCEAYGYDYGFYFSTYGSYATVDSCSFHDNIAGRRRAAIYMVWDYNNTIINCEIYNNAVNGINMRYGHDDKIINNEIHDNGESGIRVDPSHIEGYHILTGNTIYNNAYDADQEAGIYICSGPVKPVTMRNNSMYDNYNNFKGFYPNCDIDTSNTVNDGKLIYYLVQEQDITLDETDNVGWMALFGCNNIMVLNLELEGAFVKDSFDCTFKNVTRHGGEHGFVIDASLNIDFIDCVASDTTCSNNYMTLANGFVFENAPGCKIINCEMANNQKAGLYSYFSSGLEIKNCTIHNNGNEGVYFFSSSSGAEVVNNSFYTNGNYGIYLKHSSQSTLYHNNFVNNIPDNAYDKNPSTWDDGYPSGGNFWDDYTGMDNFQGPGQNISGSDGIGDTPYTNIVGADNTDNYPLMDPMKDDIPPVTTAELAGAYISGWYVSDVEITLTAVDYTGVDATYYKIDEGSWNEYTALFIVSDDGKHILYYYSVDVLGNTEYAIATAFNIDQTPPDAPVILSPLGDIEDLTPLFDWEDVIDISGISEYRLKVATDFNFINIVVDETGLAESYYQTIWPLLVPKTYYWKARAVDGLENLGEWSTIGIFNTVEDATPPTPPTLIIPLDESELESSQPFFDWTDSYDAGDIDYYTLEIATDLLFSDIVFSVNAEVSEYQLLPDDWLSSGQYYWHTRATDVAENVGDWSDVWTFTILVDTTPPVTTHSFSGMMGDNGWYVSDVEVTLSATDGGSGVESTWYKLDDSSWQEYTEGFTVSTDGLHTLLYNSTDKVGNTETTNEVELKIDQTPPVTTSVLDPSTPNGENGWYVTSVEVTLSATDEDSGVVSTWYKVDAGHTQMYSVPFTVEEDGEHIVLFYSIDSAGNQETGKSVTFKIDQTPPTTTVKFTGDEGDDNWFISDVEVELTATDTTSGVAETSYRLDDGSWTTYTAPFTITEEGVHTLDYYSVDLAGNEEDENEAEVKIDKTAPTLEVTTPVEGGLYIFGKKILSFLKTTTIIGPITVVAEAADDVSDIDRVEFTFGTAPDHTDDEAPYEWELKTKRVGMYTLTTTAFNNAGLSTATTQEMRIFCFGILGGK